MLEEEISTTESENSSTEGDSKDDDKPLSVADSGKHTYVYLCRLTKAQ